MSADYQVSQGRKVSPRAEWRGNWTVVLAAFAGVAASTIISYSSSLFIEPLQNEFGWTRAQAMSGQAIASIAGVICAPFTGLLVDRFGPRRLGIAAVISICAATAMLGLTGPSLWMWRALWLPVAFGIVLIQPSVWTAAVTSLFVTGRGLALAVTLCGSSVAAIIIPPLTYFLIETYGWRLAWAGLAGFWVLAALPPDLVLLHERKRPPASVAIGESRTGCAVSCHTSAKRHADAPLSSIAGGGSLCCWRRRHARCQPRSGSIFQWPIPRRGCRHCFAPGPVIHCGATDDRDAS
ncbi:MFS transporter [Novosphingobium sp. G106]|nr:MFS transporter [Novosphingobium sp. G106]